MEGVFPVIASNRIGDDAAGTAHAAAHNVHIRIHRAGHIAQRTAQIFAEAVYDLCGHFLALLCQIADILGGKGFPRPQSGGFSALCQHTLCQTDNAIGGGILLQTAVLTAGAGNGLSRLYRNVAEFSGAAIASGDNSAVHHHAAAHAGSQRDHDGTAPALAAALPQFAQGGHIGIIACGHIGDLRQQVVHSLFQVQHAPTQIHAFMHREISVHRSGNTDANAFYVLCRNGSFRHLFLNGRGDIRQNGLSAVFCSGGDFPLVQQISLRSKETHFHRGAAHVYAKCIRFHCNALPRPFSHGSHSKRYPAEMQVRFRSICLHGTGFLRLNLRLNCFSTPYPLVRQGFPTCCSQKYGLKGAQPAPQFSKR